MVWIVAAVWCSSSHHRLVPGMKKDHKPSVTTKLFSFQLVWPWALRGRTQISDVLHLNIRSTCSCAGLSNCSVDILGNHPFKFKNSVLIFWTFLMFSYAVYERKEHGLHFVSYIVLPSCRLPKLMFLQSITETYSDMKLNKIWNKRKKKLKAYKVVWKKTLWDLCNSLRVQYHLPPCSDALHAYRQVKGMQPAR